MLLNRIAVKIAFFLNGFMYANWVARLPRIQEIYAADNSTIGLVLLAMSIGAVGAMPFTGWLIIRNGSRKVSLFALFFYCAFVPFIPFMPGTIWLIVLYMGMGVSTGMLDVAMNAQAVMVEREYRKPIMTSFHAFFSIGMALGAGTSALFTSLLVDLPYHLMCASLVSLSAILWVRHNLVEDKPDIADRTEGPLFRLPTKGLMGVGVIAFCCMLGEGAISDWSANYMENIVRSPETLSPLALSAFATAMTLGRLLGDRGRTLFGDKRLIIYGGLVSTVGLTLTLSIPEPYVSIGGFFLVGLGLSAIVPITYSIAGNTKELSSGVALAMVTTVGYSGFLFGPPVIGFLADLTDLRLALVVVAALFVLMTLMGISVKSAEKPDPPAAGKE